MTRRLAREDAAVSAAKLRDLAVELRAEAVAFERCRENTFSPANATFYAAEHAHRVALAGVYERTAGWLARP